MSSTSDRVRHLLQQAVDEHQLPGAVFGAADRSRVWIRDAVGMRQTRPTAQPMHIHTLFDLASLTKVVATTSISFRLVEQGALRLDDPVSLFLGADFDSIRVWHLLTHTSGLAATLDLTGLNMDTPARIRAIAQAPREGAVEAAVRYSDVNFILLGHILEAISALALRELFQQEVATPLGLRHTQFGPLLDDEAKDAAATEWDAHRQQFLVGVVHDANARAAGGALGHAGLFSTVDDLLIFGQALLNRGEGPRGRWLSPATVAALARPRTPGIPGEPRAYGYQTPHPLSSAGDLMSPHAIGHTGFTGTSLWMDFDHDVTMVLLTNRVHFGREHNAPIRLRPLFHNIVLGGLPWA